MFRRRLSPDLVRRSFALAILAAIGLLLVTGVLLLTVYAVFAVTLYLMPPATA